MVETYINDHSEKYQSIDGPVICWRDEHEGSVTVSRGTYRHGYHGAIVTISWRLVDLAAEDKNDKKNRERAPSTTQVVWHPSGSYGYSLEWVTRSHQVRTE
jgi:hypothetical protein